MRGAAVRSLLYCCRAGGGECVAAKAVGESTLKKHSEAGRAGYVMRSRRLLVAERAKGILVRSCSVGRTLTRRLQPPLRSSSTCLAVHLAAAAAVAAA